MFGPWRYMTSIGYSTGSGSKWVVLFPGVREVFDSWSQAHAYLLAELQYMALDAESDETWGVWEMARKWEPKPDIHLFSVRAGDPPGLYQIIRFGHEMASDAARSGHEERTTDA